MTDARGLRRGRKTGGLRRHYGPLSVFWSRYGQQVTVGCRVPQSRVVPRICAQKAKRARTPIMAKGGGGGVSVRWGGRQPPYVSEPPRSGPGRSAGRAARARRLTAPLRLGLGLGRRQADL